MGDDTDIAALPARCALHVDRHEVEEAVALFLDDAVYDMGFARLEGGAALRSYFEDRARKGTTGRHVVANVAVDRTGDDRAEVRSTLQFHRFDLGTAPVLLGDYLDQVVRRDGRWRFAHRELTVLAVDPRLAGPPPAEES